MKTVYVETSILSYLTARPSRDLLAAAHQQVTREWWDGIDYLLTWNCRHIDNAETKPVVR